MAKILPVILLALAMSACSHNGLKAPCKSASLTRDDPCGPHLPINLGARLSKDIIS
jgi:hypothetical protein